jgi:hypothetical protein
LTILLQGRTYRVFACALCFVMVLICSKCDRGHFYCCEEHSKAGRRRNHAETQARYKEKNQKERPEEWREDRRESQQKHRDGKRKQKEATQSVALCVAASADCAVSAPQPVTAIDDWQTTAGSSAEPENEEIAANSLLTQTQQKATNSPAPVITSGELTGKDFVRAADCVPCLSPAADAVQGAWPIDGLTPERVTDHSLEVSAAQIKVSAQAHPATDDTSGKPTGACFETKPSCCMCCGWVPEPSSGVHTWPRSG